MPPSLSSVQCHGGEARWCYAPSSNSLCIVKKSYGPTFSRMPGQSHLSDLVRTAQRIESVAAARGFAPKAGNRVTLYRRVLERFLKSSEATWDFRSPNGVLLLNATRELDMMEVILKHLGGDPKWEARLASLFEGREHVADDRNHDPRSKQSELYIAAHLKNLGLHVEPGEPDILATWDGWRFGVAVKRLRKDTQYRKRLEEGYGQVRSSRFPGIVAFDLSTTLWQYTKPLFTPQPEGLIKFAMIHLTAFMRAMHPNPQPTARNDLPFGVFYITAMSSIAGPSGLIQHGRAALYLAMCNLDDVRGERMIRLHHLDEASRRRESGSSQPLR